MLKVYDFKISDESVKNVEDCLKTGMVSNESPYVHKFENSFSSYVGCDYGCATNSGTSALHLALRVLGISAGDDVITTNYSGVFANIAITGVGARPVYVDIDETWTMDPLKIKEKITSRTKAIIVVHINGNPTDMDRVNRIAKEHNLFVIEDAAQAAGSTYKDKKVGSLGDIACFSFFANKLITTGEGGMLVTNNREWLQKAKYLSSLCYPKYDIAKSYNHRDLGFNYKMSGLSAALGLGQLSKIDSVIKINRDRYNSYYQCLKKDLIFSKEQQDSNRVAIMPLMFSDKFESRHIVERLHEKGIQSRMGFVANTEMKALAKYRVLGNYPISEKLSKHGFILPLGYHITDKIFDSILVEIKRIVYEIPS